MAYQLLYPNAAGDETSITSVTGADTHWEAVDETTANTTDYVHTTSASYLRDLYNFQAHSIPSTAVIDSVTIYFRVMCNYDLSHFHAKPSQKSGATITDGTEVDTGVQNEWNTYSQVYTTNPATSAAYTLDEINSLQAGVSLDAGGPGPYSIYCTQVYIKVTYTVSIPAETLTRNTSLYHYYDRENKDYILSIGMGGLATLPMLFSEGITPAPPPPQPQPPGVIPTPPTPTPPTPIPPEPTPTPVNPSPYPPQPQPPSPPQPIPPAPNPFTGVVPGGGGGTPIPPNPFSGVVPGGGNAPEPDFGPLGGGGSGAPLNGGQGGFQPDLPPMPTPPEPPDFGPEGGGGSGAPLNGGKGGWLW